MAPVEVRQTECWIRVAHHKEPGTPIIIDEPQGHGHLVALVYDPSKVALIEQAPQTLKALEGLTKAVLEARREATLEHMQVLWNALAEARIALARAGGR